MLKTKITKNDHTTDKSHLAFQPYSSLLNLFPFYFAFEYLLYLRAGTKAAPR